MKLRRRTSPLEESFGYRFRDPSLLDLALTHRSWANEQGAGENYERLEFLGDAVLGVVTAEWLYRRHPDLPEGDLSRKKAVLVSKPALARWAEHLGVGEHLHLGVGEERSGGRTKASLLADSLEAVFGAIFLDGGLAPARDVVAAFLEGVVRARAQTLHMDAKTRLQELTQSRGWELPEYDLVAELGPDHDKLFGIECRVAGEVVGRGEGRTKKLAEQVAAAEALAALEDAG
jgi:ribonuclease-3